MQLRQLDPSLKDDFQISFPELFTSLNQKIFDIQLLERMSRDFGWNYQKVLIAQVKKKTELDIDHCHWIAFNRQIFEYIVVI